MPKGIPRDQSVQHALLHRLAIAKGHLEKVASMVKNDSYCIDVVHQSIAVQAALRKFDQAILKNHLETCAVDAVKKGQSRKVIGEILRVMEKSG